MDSVWALVARRGGVCLDVAPRPSLTPGAARIRTLLSGISAGTELALISASADDASDPVPLGYQAVGVVEEVGEAITGLVRPGDHVACYGAPYVSHASELMVPKHLMTRLACNGSGASFELCREAAFCGLGAIGLHAFRSGCLSLGEVAAVVGLGILGNIIAQVAAAAGCRVAGLETNPTRRALASGLATFDVTSSLAELQAAVAGASGGHGADAVFVASNVCDAALLADACRLVRRRGNVVIVGHADAGLPREALFEREARIVVPRAGGPGRYDAGYEANGRDYPYEHVRWTEHRNLCEFVRLLERRTVRLDSLVTHTVPVADAARAYTMLQVETAPCGAVLDWA